MAATLLSIVSSSCFDEIIVSTHPDYLEQTKQVLNTYFPNDDFVIAMGGATRHDSVENALDLLRNRDIDEQSLIAIFDGDRPGVSKQLILSSLEKAEECGASVVAKPATDSIFLSKDGQQVDRYLDRKEVFQAQTPQTFRLGLLMKAYQEGEEGTDDASLVARIWPNIAIVEGNSDNDKITYPGDLERFEATRRKPQ